MKKERNTLSKYLKETISVCHYCIKMAVEASPRYFAVCISCNLCLIAVPFVEVYLTSQILNILATSIISSEINTQDEKSFITFAIFLLVCQIAEKAVTSLKNYSDGMHREIMHQHIKYLIMQKTASLDLAFFDSSEFYDEASDASSNSPLIIDTAFKAIDLIRYLIQLFISFLYLCTFHFLLSFALILSTIPEVLLQQRQLNAMYNLQRKNLQEERKMYYAAGVATSRACIKDVKLYDLFPFIGEKYKVSFQLLFQKKHDLAGKYTKILLVCSLFPPTLTAFMVILLGIRVLNGQISIGSFSYYQGIIGQLLAAAYSVIFNYSQLMDGKVRIENYKKFMSWHNRVLDVGTDVLSGDEFTIEFRNIYFRYDDELPYVLRDISFLICSQSKVALVGINGSGKSTIVKLLLRFYDPCKGDILINGKNIKQYTIASLRRHFSTLFQDYCNYAFTVRESVTLSDYQNAGDLQKVKDALSKSGAEAFVSKFPASINTYLTRQYDENGEELSGGQWQKIATARTFFRDADIYIYDEPSASLDAEAEDELFRQFECLYQNKTAILISHRLSNVTTADQIFVLENGSILEQGTHDELMAKDGRYAYLYKLQATKYTVIES